MLTNKEPLVVIAGPTAVGKTELSIKLAQKIDGEIISGDSMQIYKGLDIGTAKIKEEEKEGIPHYLIDIIEPKEEYNVQVFQKNAREIIKDIRKRKKIPIIAGGTGLYIDSLVYDYNFISEDDEQTKIRENLWEQYNLYGSEYLLRLLSESDPESMKKIDPANIKRIIRAWEVFQKKEKKFEEMERDARESKESPYDLFYFVITMNREELYDRINKRVDLMFAEGWIEEVKGLLSSKRVLPEYRAMQSLGYKQIIQFLNNELTYDECLYKIKQETRRFAKRQLTWFRKNKDVLWLDKSLYSQEQLLEKMLNLIKN